LRLLRIASRNLGFLAAFFSSRRAASASLRAVSSASWFTASSSPMLAA